MEDFDQMAEGYDTARRIERSKMFADQIRRRVPDSQGKQAMEYGCGTGLVGMALAVDFGSMLLVDSSPKMLAAADQKIRQLGLTNVSTLCGDFTESTDGVSQMDYIFLALVLHHIPDTEAILSRLCGLLRPGGQLLIIDIDQHSGDFHLNHPGFDGHHGFSQAELAQQCKHAGFRTASAEVFYHGVKKHMDREEIFSFFILDAVK